MFGERRRGEERVEGGGDGGEGFGGKEVRGSQEGVTLVSASRMT